MINSRPLSYNSFIDFEEPLTPSHLVIGLRLINLPDYLGCMWDPEDEDFEVNTSQLTKRMKHQVSVLNHLWKHWRSEYLNELMECHCYSTRKIEHHPHVSEGDNVIVHNETLTHGLWKLGRIQELLTGHDGLPRGALVRVASRDRQYILLKRPLQLLYPLEIREAEMLKVMSEDTSVFCHDGPISDPVDESDVSTSEEPERRSVRAAAKRANEERKIWIQELQDCMNGL